MGTTYLVKVAVARGEDGAVLNFDSTGKTYSLELEDPIQIQKGIDSVLEVVNASMSTYRKESLLSRWNASASGMKVDTMLLRNFKVSLSVHAESGGAFDPTVFPLVQAWGFGPQARENPPDSARIKALLPLIGLNKVRIYGDSLGKSIPGLMLDFSAIAKGYGVDAVGWYLESLGIANYLVEIGGEVRARGRRESGQIWSIAVEKPIDDPTGTQRGILLQLPLQNRSMASSGNYRNYYKLNGRKVVHTIQPRTGYPEPSDVLGVTILAPDCMTADAYATACMAMGYRASRAMIERHPELEAIWIMSPADTSRQDFRIEYSAGLQSLLASRSTSSSLAP